MANILVEICAGSLSDCLAAQQGGADRIELNSALTVGGLTPSLALFEQVRPAVSLPLIAMVRPRAGNFCYTETEFDQMTREAELLLAAGANGLAFGITHPDGSVDSEKCRRLMDRFREAAIEWVFHRAIDVSPDWRLALRSICEIGFQRVLTSGLEKTAPSGAACLTEMLKTFGERIEIMAGCGISAENALELVKTTGIRQIHGSFSVLEHDFDQSVAPFGRVNRTDPERVRLVVESLKHL